MALAPEDPDCRTAESQRLPGASPPPTRSAPGATRWMLYSTSNERAWSQLSSVLVGFVARTFPSGLHTADDEHSRVAAGRHHLGGRAAVAGGGHDDDTLGERPVERRLDLVAVDVERHRDLDHLGAVRDDPVDERGQPRTPAVEVLVGRGSTVLNIA